MKKLREKIEGFLYRQGFTHPQVRRVMLVQVYVALAMCAAGLALGGFAVWPLFMALGALLATWNFYHLSRSVSQLVYVEYSRGMLVGLVVRFYGRLLVTGFVLAALIYWGGAPMSALLTGLSSVVATIVCWGALQMTGTTLKEA